jgi:ferric-dicitrate binding protein FerR (iron transport regulator)
MHVDWKLLLKYLKGECTESEKAEFENWLALDKEHSLFFEIVKKSWNESGELHKNFKPDLSSNWQAIENKLITNDKNVQSQNRNFSLTFAISAAAAIALIFVVGAILMYQLKKEVKFVYVKSNNCIREILLPDSSKAWLNKNSFLVFPEKYNGKKRTAILSGEAFFEISHDKQKPFEIYAGNSITHVVGTSFYINTRKAINQVVIKVNDGKVLFWNNYKSLLKLSLIKNDKAFVTNSEAAKKVVDNNVNDYSWKTGIVYFENDRLDEVCRFLSSYFQHKINCERDISGKRLTFGFSKKNEYEVISGIEATLDIKSFKKEDTIIFTQK